MKLVHAETQKLYMDKQLYSAYMYMYDLHISIALVTFSYSMSSLS